MHRHRPNQSMQISTRLTALLAELTACLAQAVTATARAPLLAVTNHGMHLQHGTVTLRAVQHGIKPDGCPLLETTAQPHILLLQPVRLVASGGSC